MQYPDRETLSQLMDGEWQGIEPSQCAAGICADDTLRSTWARYHLIRDSMNNAGVHAGYGLAASVREAIEYEPVYSNVSSIAGDADDTATASAGVIQAGGEVATFGTWRRAASGFAIAASVALVTVVGLNVWQGSSLDGSPGGGMDGANSIVADAGSQLINRQADTVAEAGSLNGQLVSLQIPIEVLPQVEYVANRGAYWVTPQSTREAAIEERLNMFLSQHIENSPTADRQGMLPYSRLVGYDQIAVEQ
jgi:sigma-E factor negative regulatory protein RseA